MAINLISPDSPVKIKIVSAGSGAISTLNYLKRNIKGDIEYIAIDSDPFSLEKSTADIRIKLGSIFLKGLEYIVSPGIGFSETIKSKNYIEEKLCHSGIIFLITCLGGKTGSGSAPVIAEIAKSLGSLVISVVTLPFDFESIQRRKTAEKALNEIRQKVDSLIVIQNQKIINLLSNESSLESFRIIDRSIRNIVSALTYLITGNSVIKINLNDIFSVFKGKPDTYIGIGLAEGENRTVNALKYALNNFFLQDVEPENFKNIIICIRNGGNLKMTELESATKHIYKIINPEAKFILGIQKEDYLKDKIIIILIFSGPVKF